MLIFLRRMLTLCAFLVALVTSGAAFAQAVPAPQSAPAETIAPEDMTPEMIDDMVARMSDADVRNMLLDRLDAVAEENAETTPRKGFFALIGEAWAKFIGNIYEIVTRLPLLISGQIEAFQNFVAHYGASGLATLFGLIAGVLALGFVAEFIVKALTRRWQTDNSSGEEADLSAAVSFLFRRLVREVAGLIAFYLVVRLVGRTLLNADQLTFAAPFVFYLIFLPRLGAAVSRFILAPNRADMRLVNISDHWARYLHRNQIGLVFLGAFAVWIVLFNAANGVPVGTTRIGAWLNFFVHVYVGIIAWSARDGLIQMMRGTDPDITPFDEKVARAYPIFAVAVTALLWVVVNLVSAYGNFALLLTSPQYVTMFWLLMAPALDTLIRGLVRHLQPPMLGEGEIALQAYKETKRGFIRIGRVIVGGLIIMLVANAWQIKLFSLSGGDVGAAVFQFLLTVAVGYIVYEGVSLYINRGLAKEFTSRVVTEDEAQGEGGGAGGSRLATVLPLARVTAQAAIAVIFGLLAIGSLGIDITPLLAGAGILGLAIGFGAQKLVSDIVSGVFFLIDDAFRVGEYVEVGGTMGTVEKISIRSMQLRHHRGPVHTIPYGEIPQLTNYSRDWVIMKLKFTVPFDTDPNKVKKIFKKIGAEMMEDEIHKDGFLQPFKSQGVFDFDDVGMVIRGKFMAKPGQQFTIRKEIFNRVKREFNAAGIEFARREVRVAIPDALHEDGLSEADSAAISAAAAAAAQQDAQKP